MAIETGNNADPLAGLNFPDPNNFTGQGFRTPTPNQAIGLSFFSNKLNPISGEATISDFIGYVTEEELIQAGLERGVNHLVVTNTSGTYIVFHRAFPSLDKGDENAILVLFTVVSFTDLFKEPRAKNISVGDIITGQPIQIQDVRVASDALIDELLISSILTNVHSLYSGNYPKVRVKYITGFVVPTRELVDYNQKSYAKKVVIAAFNRLSSGNLKVRGLDLNSEGFDPANIAGVTFNIMFGETPLTHTDVLGYPLHNPVVINLSAVQGGDTSRYNARKVSDFGGTSEDVIASVGYKLDLLRNPSYNAQMANATQYNNAPGAPNYHSRYLPVLVADNYDSPGCGDSTAALLMGMTCALSLIHQRNYWRLLINKNNDGVHNLGLLNLEAGYLGNFNKFIIDASTPANDINMYLNYILLPTVELALDVSHSSLSSSAFSDMIAVSKNNQDAIRQVIQVLDGLSKGRFSKMWNPADPIIQYRFDGFPDGFYFDNTRQKRPISAMTHFTIQSLLGENQPNYVEQWALANVMYSMAPALRFKIMSDIIHAVAPGAQITGKRTRLFFNARFVETLFRAIFDPVDGIKYSIQSPGDMNMILATQMTITGLNSNMVYLNPTMQNALWDNNNGYTAYNQYNQGYQAGGVVNGLYGA